MDASNIKRQALYLVIGALGCVLVWKIAPLFKHINSGDPGRRECDPGAPRASGFGAGERQYDWVRPCVDRGESRPAA